MNSNRLNKQHFWFLLERKASGNATRSELAQLDKMVTRSAEANNTAILLERLWQCPSADEIESVIRRELAESHERNYLWPQEYLKRPRPNSTRPF